MINITKELVSYLRNEYPVGTRIRCIHMDDPWNPVKPGTVGTFKSIDDMAQLHVAWDNGRTLALCYGIDEFSVEDEQAKEEDKK